MWNFLVYASAYRQPEPTVVLWAKMNQETHKVKVQLARAHWFGLYIWSVCFAMLQVCFYSAKEVINDVTLNVLVRSPRTALRKRYAKYVCHLLSHKWHIGKNRYCCLLRALCYPCWVQKSVFIHVLFRLLFGCFQDVVFFFKHKMAFKILTQISV